MPGTTKALIIGAFHYCTQEIDELCKRHNIEYVSAKSRLEFFEDCKGKYKDVTAAVLTYDCVPALGKFDKEFIENLPPNLKFLNFNAAGYDSVDVDACTARGIYLSNTPAAVDDATADIASILILTTLRNTSSFERNLRKGRWKFGIPLGTDPQGKRLGIFGMGGIGKAVAKRMRGFDMEIQYHNRHRLDAEVESQYAATYVDFDTLLRTSDVLFVSVPLSASTFHLLDAKEFAKVKDGIIIVNTARGKVINEAALVKALESGKVAAAGLDVYEEEPKIHPGLLSHPRSVLLPHIGTNTKETMRKMELVVVENFKAALDRDTLVTPVPEHKKFFQQ